MYWAPQFSEVILITCCQPVNIQLLGGSLWSPGNGILFSDSSPAIFLVSCWPLKCLECCFLLSGAGPQLRSFYLAPLKLTLPYQFSDGTQPHWKWGMPSIWQVFFEWGVRILLKAAGFQKLKLNAVRLCKRETFLLKTGFIWVLPQPWGMVEETQHAQCTSHPSQYYFLRNISVWLWTIGFSLERSVCIYTYIHFF